MLQQCTQLETMINTQQNNKSVLSNRIQLSSAFIFLNKIHFINPCMCGYQCVLPTTPNSHPIVLIRRTGLQREQLVGILETQLNILRMGDLNHKSNRLVQISPSGGRNSIQGSARDNEMRAISFLGYQIHKPRRLDLYYSTNYMRYNQ